MKNEKRVMLLSLTILVILLTGFTWAYWNSGEVLGPTLKLKAIRLKLERGSAERVETTLTASVDDQDPHAILLPKSIDEDQSYVKIPYEVLWKTDSDLISGAKGSLHFDHAQLVMKDEDPKETRAVLDALFSINFDHQEKVLSIDDKDTVLVTVSFDKEPKDKQEYDLIAGKELLLKFDMVVQVENN